MSSATATPPPPPPPPAAAVEITRAALKIGIVGFGPFAQFLSKTILKHHPQYSITATSRSDYSHLSSRLGIPFFRDLERFCEEDHDVILLCPSILSFSHIIRSIPFNRFPKPPLVVDVLSVKEYPKDLLLHVLPEGCDLLCTHPMFGPESGKDGWNNLAFVYDKVRIRDQHICNTFLWIFEREAAFAKESLSLSALRY
ncbi:ATP-binding cassette transporter CGR1 [Asimina triloba]